MSRLVDELRDPPERHHRGRPKPLVAVRDHGVAGLEVARRQLLHALIAARSEGAKLDELGEMLGVSRQRILDLLRQVREHDEG